MALTEGKEGAGGGQGAAAPLVALVVRRAPGTVGGFSEHCVELHPWY